MEYAPIPYFVVVGHEPDDYHWDSKERIVAVSTWEDAVYEKGEAEAYGWTNVEIETRYYEPQTYDWEDGYASVN